jgi:hypothetical protein
MTLAKIILARYVKYMTAQRSSDMPKEEVICHIYNHSAEGKNIFSDAEDYASFLTFLGEYLVPYNPENKTKEFAINGKTYKGVPHQPKNYSGIVELLAYSLVPNKFDLLIKHSNKDILQRFMRSLSTRYSIYLHKKYPNSGSVFRDSYRSEDIKDDKTLLNLSYELHHNIQISSYQEYLGTRKTEWINADLILNLFKKLESGSYKDFVETKSKKENIECAPKVDKEIDQQEQEYVMITPNPGFREIFVAGSLFLVLLTFGFKNVYASSNTSKQFIASNTAVLSEKTEVLPTPSPQREFAKVSINENLSMTINIYTEASVTSEIVAKAFDENVFEIISLTEDGKWCEIKLNDDLTGYILTKNTQIYQNE